MTPVEIGSWRGEAVHLGQVLDALGELRRSGQRTATRASVTNLVLVAASEDEVERGCEAVHRVGRRHPGRNIVLLPRPRASPAGIDAQILLHGSEGPGQPVWSEDIRLEVRGPAAARLSSLVEPLTLADVPVAVWFVSGLPQPDDPLLRRASTVVVDTDTVEDGGVAAMVRLARRRVVVDLCWARLRPYRQAMAGLFEVPARRPFLGGVREVEACGTASARRLLAGWVASRLGLSAAGVRLTPAAAPALRFTAVHDATTATFTVELEAAAGRERVVRAYSDLVGAGHRDDRVSLPDDLLASSLGEALAHPGRERAHVQALHAALGLAA